jgi:hypothetical protein
MYTPPRTPVAWYHGTVTFCFPCSLLFTAGSREDISSGETGARGLSGQDWEYGVEYGDYLVLSAGLEDWWFCKGR